ncbi:hypothetical protein [Halospina sp. K52047b]|uniref:hypothetical protein n=1 Tax=Halospina sp. K52047b TaxID=2614160 RepID=UPI00124A8A2D|nr:hypothetical protein [Halospina sp. K52047b]KAA8983329.1 hypothetical protein F3089_04680 [Halospina sp. K52047b]
MKQLRTTKTRLAVCLLVSAGVTGAHAQEERLDRLESQLERLQQDMRDSRDTDFRINGFMSTGYARASNNAGYAGVTEESEIRPLTLFAVQGTFDLSDQTRATFQLLSRGEQEARDNWETQLEWGYLSHQMDNGLRVRAGKMRMPLFMYSDSLDLGYAQPFARAPSAVYDQVSLSSYTGVDATYTFDVLGQSIRTQVFGGHSQEDRLAGQNNDIFELELRNIAGAVMSWTDYTWTLRGVAARADTNFVPFGAQDDDGEFFGLGVEYEKGNIMAVSEVTRRNVDGAFPDRDGAYATLGYRFDSVMPYVTYAWVETQDDENRPVAPTSSQASLATQNEKREDYSIGVRWDAMPGIALKADWTHSRAFGDTSGALSGNAASFASGQGNRFDHTNVYTLKLDAAF